MAGTHFKGPVYSANGFVGAISGSPVTLQSYTVAGVPAAAGKTGQIIYVTNGLAGQPVIAYSDGTNWKTPAGANISAT